MYTCVVLTEAWRIRSVEQEALFLPEGSSTFHGRDRFAPVAAAIAGGVPFISLGPALRLGDLVALPYQRPRVGENEVTGTIVSIDRFGNAITDVDAGALGDLRQWRAATAGGAVAACATTYAEMEGRAEPFLIRGSSGTVEISVSGGSAADVLQLRRLQEITFTKTSS